MSSKNGYIRKICIATSTRADWGLLSPLAQALKGRSDCQLSIVATNMHLSEKFGMTVNEIISDGFEPLRVEMDSESDSPQARIAGMAECMTGMSDVLTRLNPDLIVILGDRYEMLAVATTAIMLKIPIVHIAGGTISEGAIDDSIRHAITKLSALHLTETEEYRRRIIAMGEDPRRVFNTGAIGVWNISHLNLLSLHELSHQLEFDLSTPFVVATFHPSTLDPGDPGEQCRAMLAALDRHPELKIILTYPNNDAGSSAIIEAIEDYASARPEKVKLVRSLGLRRYLSALNYAEFSIGNSSSGIVEVASSGIPSIDIGMRQRGRAAAETVIHCGTNVDEIDAAIRLALSEDMKTRASAKDNPYFRPDTLDLMVKAIMEADPEDLRIKHFHDI